MKTLKESILGSMGMGDEVVKWELFFDAAVDCINDIKESLEKLYGCKWDVLYKYNTEYITKQQMSVIQFTSNDDVTRRDNKCQKIYDGVYKWIEKLLKDKHWEGKLTEGSAKDKKNVNVDIKTPVNGTWYFGFYDEKYAKKRFSISIIYDKEGISMAEKKFSEFK